MYRYFFPNAREAQPGPSRGRGIAATVSEIAREKAELVRLGRLNRPLVIVVEGAGDWVEQAYRALFKKKGGENLSVFYADDTRWKPSPAWADGRASTYDVQVWETYLDKADSLDFAIYQNLRPDAVFIVTPDFTHAAIARWWLGKTPLIFVEKPFDSRLDNVDGLLRDLGQHRGTAILGLDHYAFYALPLHDLKPTIAEHLGGALARVVFYMTEERPVELDRVRSLQYGLTLDMLPHLPALLTYFGNVGTIDEIRVVDAGQYRPLIAANRDRAIEADISQRFRNETAARVQFTFQDYSGNGYRVPCLAVVGKGFAQEVKYFEVTGRNGNALRVDLNRKPAANRMLDYPWDSVFLLYSHEAPLCPDTQIRELMDPYDPQRTLRILYDPDNPRRYCQPLERGRYEKLLDDLLYGTKAAAGSTLLLPEAWEIVRALDRIWWAVQATQPWKVYDLWQLNPVQSEGMASTVQEPRAAAAQMPETTVPSLPEPLADRKKEHTVTEQPRKVKFVDKQTLRPLVSNVFEEMGIHGEPMEAEEVQKMIASSGVKPEENTFSRGIIEMREE
jgi:predicted dehydrogenase